MPEYKPPKPNNVLEAGLGFRVQIDPNGMSGHVIWFESERPNSVRPATGVEIKLWQTLIIATAGDQAVPAENASDPFGTPPVIQEGP